MPIPVEPYIDIPSGDVHGEIVEGQSFSWYNSNMSSSCSISNFSDWCTTPSSILGPGASQSATAKMVTGNYSFSSPCHNGPSPVIIVHPVIEEKPRKTA